MRYLCLLLAFCLISACGPAPEGEATGLDPAEFHGRWLVVNYWAEWCQPCRQEIPELNRLAAQLPDQVAVLGVNYDGLAGADLAEAVAVMKIEFPASGQDPAAVLQVERPTVLPTTYLFNPAGELAHTLLGPQTYDTLLKLVNSPLAEEQQP